MKHWPGPEHQELHRRAQLDHLHSEITRIEGMRNRYPVGSVEYVRAQKELDRLHARLQRGEPLKETTPLLPAYDFTRRNAS